MMFGAGKALKVCSDLASFSVGQRSNSSLPTKRSMIPNQIPEMIVMRMNFGALRLGVGALFLVLWTGCYPGEIDSASQTDVVLTFHAPNADFTVNSTLSMPDSIVD